MFVTAFTAAAAAATTAAKWLVAAKVMTAVGSGFVAIDSATKNIKEKRKG